MAAEWNDAATAAGPVADALAFDYAPSFNFQTDCFVFDAELRAVQRGAPYAPHVLQLARRAQRTTFGDEPYLAVHMRRDGYEQCARAWDKQAQSRARETTGVRREREGRHGAAEARSWGSSR